MLLAQIANIPQLPELPEGPSLDRVFGPVEITAHEPWQVALAVVATSLVLGLVVWLIIRSRQKKDHTTPPYQIAISGLEAANSLVNEENEHFAVLCSQALRSYLENGLGLKFSACTSEEFLRSLKGNSRLKSDYQDELAGVLQAFDRIKFARAKIGQKERNEISDTVRLLIDRAHKTTKTKGGVV